MPDFKVPPTVHGVPVALAEINAAGSKSTPVAADQWFFWDSVTSLFKKLTTTQMITWLTTLFVDLTTTQSIGGLKTFIANLTISSVTTTGNALRVVRNLTLTSTDAPVVHVLQDHASDDQVALLVENDGGAAAIYAKGPNPFLAERVLSATTGARGSMTLAITTSGAAADGFGPVMQYTMNDSDNPGVLNTVARHGPLRNGSDDSADFVLLVYNAGVEAEAVRFTKDRLVQMAAYFTWAGQKRVTTQFDKAASTALATVTGLTVNVEAGKTYDFEATLHINASAAGGIKVAIAGTCTATNIIYHIEAMKGTGTTNDLSARHTALGGSSAISNDTSYYVTIRGTITVNAAGTLLVQFAQNVASGTSSVLVGSTFTVRQQT